MGKKKPNSNNSIASDRVLAEDAADDKDSISSFEKINLHSVEHSERGSPVPSSQTSAGLTTTPPVAEDEILPIEEEQQPGTHGNLETTTNTTLPNNASPSGRSIDPVVRELEEAAAVAAAAASEAAAATKQKFLEGADKAKAFMTSFWSAFDDPTTSAAKEQQSEAALRQRLGLQETEAILEVFRCKLIQSYSPSKNDFTGPKNIAFSGQLHVATEHVCFELDGAGGASAAPISIPRKELKGVHREGDALRIELLDNRELIVGAFSLPRLEVESALTLIQSLADSNDE